MEQFFEYLQKHYAVVISTLVSVAILVVNLWIAKRRLQKVFSYREISDQPLIPKTKTTPDNIEILYGGKPVTNVRVYEMEMRNSGGKEIEAKDFDKPIRIVFPDGTEILKADITESSPEFDPVPELNGCEVTIKPILMNQGDFLKIKVLAISDKKLDTIVRGKIAGIKLRAYQPRIKTRRNILRAMNYGAFGFLWLLTIMFTGIFGPFTGMYWTQLLFVSAQIMLAGVGAMAQSVLIDLEETT